MMKKIAEAYADEFFTDSFFEEGGEMWDVDALNWFDEHHPNLTDEQRAEFARHLDSIRSERSIPAYERLLAAQGQNARSTDPRNVELLDQAKTCLKEHNFVEAAKLLNELKSIS